MFFMLVVLVMLIKLVVLSVCARAHCTGGVSSVSGAKPPRRKRRTAANRVEERGHARAQFTPTSLV
jgi:hypothetical protein